MRTVVMLACSNIFMTRAWDGHLNTLSHQPLLIVMFISWGIAFFEYCFQVPANRLGYGMFSLQPLKVLQEIITMTGFAGFAVWCMGERLTWNFLWASVCLAAAAFFIFRGFAAVGAIRQG